MWVSCEDVGGCGESVVWEWVCCVGGCGESVVREWVSGEGVGEL